MFEGGAEGAREGQAVQILLQEIAGGAFAHGGESQRFLFANGEDHERR